MAEARIARRLGCPVAIGGGTALGAEAAVQRLISEGVRGLISFGLAGGLDPALRPGTLLVPSEVIVSGVKYPSDAELMVRLGGATPHLLLADEAVAASPEDKRRLHRATAAAALDVESGVVARIATAHHMPFAVLRAICDPAERALPSAATAALDAQGRIDLRRILSVLARHPDQLVALFALAADAARARRALVSRVRRLVLAQQPSMSA